MAGILTPNPPYIYIRASLTPCPPHLFHDPAPRPRRPSLRPQQHLTVRSATREVSGSNDNHHIVDVSPVTYTRVNFHSRRNDESGSHRRNCHRRLSCPRTLGRLGMLLATRVATIRSNGAGMGSNSSDQPTPLTTYKWHNKYVKFAD